MANARGELGRRVRPEAYVTSKAADDLDTLLGRSDEIRRGDLHTLRLCTGAPITGPPPRDPPGARERAAIKAVERDTTFTRRRGLAANTLCTSALDAAGGQLGFAGRAAGDLILARSEEILVAPGPDEIDVTDRARLARAVDFIESNDTGTVISQLLPGLSGDQADAVAARCSLSHAAVLVFPRSLSGLHDHLHTTAGGWLPFSFHIWTRFRKIAVGRTEFEPVTSSVSGNFGTVLGVRHRRTGLSGEP